MKKLFKCVALFLVVLQIFAMAGCLSSNPSELNYWFSDTSQEFIKYDETKNNLDECGSYWYFVAGKEVEITLSVKINVDNYTSYAYLYVNDKQVKSELDVNIYSYVYKLSLKKGDVIKLHASWVYGVSASDEEFEIYSMVIAHEGNQYLIKDFDQTTAN